jgi:hypothetical protein
MPRPGWGAVLVLLACVLLLAFYVAQHHHQRGLESLEEKLSAALDRIEALETDKTAQHQLVSPDVRDGYKQCDSKTDPSCPPQGLKGCDPRHDSYCVPMTLNKEAMERSRRGTS